MKVLTVVQARMGSTRLPKKTLMEINGKPILEIIIEFLKLSKLTSKIIVATTDLQEDDKIEELCTKLNIECFRGNANDVLQRYYDCAKLYKGDLVVRITADDPLIDSELVDQVIQTCKETKCDFASTAIVPGYPMGYFIEALTYSTLEWLNLTQKDMLTREHVTYHIKQNLKSFNVQKIIPPSNLFRPNWRLTIDYEEDLFLISKIFEKLYKKNSFIKYISVVELLDNNLELLEINQKYIQRNTPRNN